MKSVKLSALTVQMPRRSYANDDPVFERLPEMSNRWWKFWGVQKRGYFRPEDGENEYRAAAECVKRILTSTGLVPDDIDLVICASSCPVMTDGPDELAKRPRLYPRLNAALKRDFGFSNALCWDVQMECASFLLAMGQATAFIKSGQARNALVICSEYISNMLDFTARSATIFGDGCACALLTASDDSCSDMLAMAQSSNADFYEIATGRWRLPESPCSSDTYKLYFTLLEEGQAKMQAFVPEEVPKVVRQALALSDLTFRDIDFFVFHQPSPFLVHAWASGVGCEEERTLLTMEEQGVMVSVSLPFTLFKALQQKRIQARQHIVLAGAATGWGFAAQVWKMDDVVLC
ncbi:3-oxoacyl-ACP synthase III family protein [Zobellella sp. DQSA1]|uniref:3-oxoacyl-ACP synthase III family protein n=1 Tax=Zobellella sp. DQSA1 TaxID=3342386 RepID=UPI0035C1E9AB